jgi:hypothetical protein
MADWATISSLVTGAGTLVLAVATFASVRSANRAARIAERALLAGTRPVLVPSRFEDPPEKVGFVDGHWVRVPGGCGAVEVTDDAIYLVIALRNVGPGLAVLDRWDLVADQEPTTPYRAPDGFRRLSRDIYISSGNLGFWQGALRDRGDPLFEVVRQASDEGRRLTLDLLYGDHEGAQHTISRFTLLPRSDGNGWVASVARHWNLDRPDPR